MLGLGLGLNKKGSVGYGLPELTKRYIDRVLIDGGVIESKSCLEVVSGN